MENYILKHSNGNIFHYTHLLEAIDGFIDNYDVIFSSTLILEQENKEKELISYNHISNKFIFTEHFDFNIYLFMAKFEDRLAILNEQTV